MAPKNPEQVQKRKAPKLPAIVASPSDVSRLTNELTQINEVMLQLKLRDSGQNTKIPKTSRLMDLTIDYNQLNLLKEEDRQLLGRLLRIVGQKAPQLHFSFSADPSGQFVEKLVIWLRKEIHPYVLITIGLQPGIGAGCMVRSTNKYFDFSLRQTFIDKKKLLQENLGLNRTVAES